MTPRHILIDLDGFDPPTSVFVDEDGDPEGHNPVLSIAKNQPEVLNVMTKTRSADVEWNVTLHLLVNGNRKTIKIDNGGKPFRTMGSDGACRLTWSGSSWVDMNSPTW